jgi:hypothetical protein
LIARKYLVRSSVPEVPHYIVITVKTEDPAPEGSKHSLNSICS